MVAVPFVFGADDVQHDRGRLAHGVQLPAQAAGLLAERRYDFTLPCGVGVRAAGAPATGAALLADADVHSFCARDGALPLRATLSRVCDAAVFRAVSEFDWDPGRVYTNQESDSVAGGTL